MASSVRPDGKRYDSSGGLPTTLSATSRATIPTAPVGHLAHGAAGRNQVVSEAQAAARRFPRTQANALVSSRDLITLEDLQVRSAVRNRQLAKAISHVGWAPLAHWIVHDGQVQRVLVIAVPPHSTSQRCSDCGALVRQSLTMQTHLCPHCGQVVDRDHYAAAVISGGRAGARHQVGA